MSVGVFFDLVDAGKIVLRTGHFTRAGAQSPRLEAITPVAVQVEIRDAPASADFTEQKRQESARAAEGVVGIEVGSQQIRQPGTAQVSQKGIGIGHRIARIF